MDKKTPEEILTDPTGYGQTYMPPWSVTCTKCGNEMISYKNQPTKECKGCGAKVQPSTHIVPKELPPHGKITTGHEIEKFTPEAPEKVQSKKKTKPVKKVLEEQYK